MANIRQDSMQWAHQQDHWKQLVEIYARVLRSNTKKTRAVPSFTVKNRQFLRCIFENNKYALAIMDRQLHYLYVNQLYMRRFCQKLENQTGQQTDTDMPDLGSQWKNACQLALSGKLVAMDDNPYGHDHESDDLIHWKCHPWFESSGQIGGVILYAEHEPELVKEALSSQDQIRFYQTTYDLIPVGLAMIDRKSSRILWKNQQFMTVFGHDDLSAWAFLFSSDALRQEQMSALGSGKIDCYENIKPFTNTCGQESWLKIRISPCGHSDDPAICYLLMVEDISSSKKAEEELTFLKYHDGLTQLYNRTYFDLAKKELDQASNLPLSYVICDINGLKLINETMSYTAGDKVLLSTARILSDCCREGDLLARIGGDEYGMLLPKTDKQSAVALLNRITAAAKTRTSLNSPATGFISLSLGYATKETAAEPLDRIIKDAENHLVRQKLFEQKSLHSSLLASIKATMHEKSFETKEHGERMAQMARTLGRSLGLSDSQLQDLELLANMHDIGKIIIDDRILNKPGKLSDEEWLEMKKHPEIGYRIAQASPDIKHIADSILFHHERWDGNGYPQGLTGEHIPVFSRILAIVDAFDAMTNDRAYRSAMTHSDALCEIKQNAGSQFDPVIAEEFIHLLKHEALYAHFRS